MYQNIYKVPLTVLAIQRQTYQKVDNEKQDEQRKLITKIRKFTGISELHKIRKDEILEMQPALLDKSFSEDSDGLVKWKD